MSIQLDRDKVLGTRRTSCTTAGPIFASVSDGKILRVEPMKFEEEEVDSWHVDVNGKQYKPALTHAMLHWGLTSKYMAYTDNRVKYPLKRVDWDPKGERNQHMRGVSGYERISWDEAIDIIVEELNRVADTYGQSAICQSQAAHSEWGSMHMAMSDWARFWMIYGATMVEPTAVSWESWAVGATYLWGFWETFGVANAPDSLQDVSEESELLVLWGNEPLFHNLYSGVDQARIWHYWRELGKKIIVIEPLANETYLYAADKWIPIYPGTDGAMAAAIAYVWITEGTYDQEYLDTHAIGFDEEHLPEDAPAGSSFKSYILGEGRDGTPKTPEWAEERCGVSAKVIKALARQWASRPTALWVQCGGSCRRQFAHDFARMSATLQIMQGLGKPGVSILGSFCSLSGPYDRVNQIGPLGYAEMPLMTVLPPFQPNMIPQRITYSKFYDCVCNAPHSWDGGHGLIMDPAMFREHADYPAPGCSEIHLLWHRGSNCFCEPEYNRHIEALRSPSLETVIMQAPWFDRHIRNADLVLPVTTALEAQDLTEPARVGSYVPPAYTGLRSAVFSQQVIEPVGESRTDLDILAEVAERLGISETFLAGNDEESLLKKLYANTNIPMEYDDFKEKGYYVWPQPRNYEPCKQFKKFYEDPEGNPVNTPTGKFEIFSTRLFAMYGDDDEIPPVPHYIPEREGHESTEIKERYPFQLLMAHPKFRFHGKYNNCEWLAENYKVYVDGYPYEPIWMTPKDAGALNLKDGDVVRVFNDRGQVLAGVRVTDRLIEGVAWLSYGAFHDPLDPVGSFDSIDRGGNGNVLTSRGPMSKHSVSGGYNSNLVAIEKADLTALREQYPEGFAGKYRSWNREG